MFGVQKRWGPNSRTLLFNLGLERATRAPPSGTDPGARVSQEVDGRFCGLPMLIGTEKSMLHPPPLRGGGRGRPFNPMKGMEGGFADPSAPHKTSLESLPSPALPPSLEALRSLPCEAPHCEAPLSNSPSSLRTHFEASLKPHLKALLPPPSSP